MLFKDIDLLMILNIYELMNEKGNNIDIISMCR